MPFMRSVKVIKICPSFIFIIVDYYYHYTPKSQTPVDQWFTPVFKFSVDGTVDGFFNDHVVNALQVSNHFKAVTKSRIRVIYEDK